MTHKRMTSSQQEGDADRSASPSSRLRREVEQKQSFVWGGLVRDHKTNRKRAAPQFKSRFVEIFGDPAVNSKKYPMGTIPKYAENLDSMRVPVTQGDRKPGPYPYIGASGQVDSVSDYIFDETLLLISEDGANLLMRTSPIAFTITGKTWVNNHAHVLRCKSNAIRVFLQQYINMIDITEWVTGSAQPKLNQKRLNTIPVPLVAVNQMQEFANFVDQVDKLRFEACYAMYLLCAALTLLWSTMAYMSVVSIFAWPKSRCTCSMGIPLSMAFVASVRRNLCG